MAYSILKSKLNEDTLRRIMDFVPYDDAEVFAYKSITTHQFKNKCTKRNWRYKIKNTVINTGIDGLDYTQALLMSLNPHKSGWEILSDKTLDKIFDEYSSAVDFYVERFDKKDHAFRRFQQRNPNKTYSELHYDMINNSSFKMTYK